MTGARKVLSNPATRALYEKEAAHRQQRGTLGPFAVRGGRGHATRLLRGQRRRMIGVDYGYAATRRQGWNR